MKDYNDEELLRRIARGDSEAGKALFLRFRQKAYRVAYRLLGNEADALDAVEDAFVKVLTAAGAFRGESSARTWFYRILTNTALDLRRKRRPTVSLDAAQNEDDETVDITESREESPAGAVERGETGQKIREAIDALDEKHKTVFVLAAIEEMSYKEIAAALGISIGTVMSRLFYARKYLQKSLRGYIEASDERM